MALEHRGLGLLDLQDERVARALAQQEDDEAAGAHGAHAHHLARHIDGLEAVEEVRPVAQERLAVAVERRLDDVLGVVAAIVVDEDLRERDQDRWVRSEPEAAGVDGR